MFSTIALTATTPARSVERIAAFLLVVSYQLHRPDQFRILYRKALRGVLKFYNGQTHTEGYSKVGLGILMQIRTKRVVFSFHHHIKLTGDPISVNLPIFSSDIAYCVFMFLGLSYEPGIIST